MYWKDIRKRVALVDPIFTNFVDELNPGKEYPLYLAYYDYGMCVGDTISAILPSADGSYYRLSAPDTPDEVKKHLGYGLGACPFAVVLEKTLEYFIDLQDKNVTVPWCISRPGFFFPLSRILSRHNSRIYSPNGLLKSTAGARSTFMLANIGSEDHHLKLRSHYNVRTKAPKKLYHHFQIFKEIANRKILNIDNEERWKACVLYFSEAWISSLLNDITWMKVRLHLHEIGWKRSEYERGHIQYDVIASLIQRQRGLKPNPYIADTACHLFALAIGAMPGYAPAINEDSLPLKLLQKAYTESYGLDKYIPCIMEPTEFQFEQNGLPVYYSLKYPSTLIFSPKAVREPTVLHELQELEHIEKILVHVKRGE